MLYKQAMGINVEGITEVSDEDTDRKISPSGQIRVKRASITFKQGGDADIEDLKIENERMKTTLMVMSQKLKLKQEDKLDEDEKWQS
jgi:hypothetical protein